MLDFRMGWRYAAAVTFAAAMLVQAAPAADAASTIETVRQRGSLRCGLNPIVGYAELDARGRWSGFFVDFCRAVAAAVLGRADAIEVVAIESSNRFDALASGSVDLLTEGTTWTLSRDQSFDFPGIYLYDGQGFLVHRELGVTRLAEAGEATVCAIDQTTSLKNLRDHIRLRGLRLKVLAVRSDEGGWSSFLKRRCDMFTNDVWGLVVRRQNHSPDPERYLLLPDVISKEPLGPVVRQDDRQWFELVRWVLLAMIAAEEKGVSSSNLGGLGASADPEVRLLVGLDPDHGERLGVGPGWARRVIEQVGNYGEVFDRHLGKKSPLKADRGLNRLWTDGGLLYAPPLQ